MNRSSAWHIGQVGYLLPLAWYGQFYAKGTLTPADQGKFAENIKEILILSDTLT